MAHGGMEQKRLLLILDGAADRPCLELGNRTPLEAAQTPNTDRLARNGVVGRARTVPEEFTAASDVANLSLLGHNPIGVYTGRGPLEAAAMGVDLEPDDIAFRVNTVTLAEEKLKDYSAGHITTEESRRIIEDLQPVVKELGGALYPGVQYRHLMVRRDGAEWRSFPPHDNIGRSVEEMLPPSGPLREIFERSRDLLREHPVNEKRRAEGKNTVDALWPWGQGKAVRLRSIREEYGVRGALVSAVDLVRGIGVLAGYEILRVEGITGYYNTNYAGKGEAMIEAFASGVTVGVVHVEPPDEAGHEGKADEKVRALERIDEFILGPILEAFPDIKVLIAPDHPTYLETRCHGSEPVPFLFYDSRVPCQGPEKYAESTASGEVVEGWSLLPRLMEGVSK